MSVELVCWPSAHYSCLLWQTSFFLSSPTSSCLSVATCWPGHGSDHVMCVCLTHNGPVLQMFPPVSLSRAYSPTCASVTVLREPQCVCLSTSQSVSLRKNILLETICHVEDLEKLPFPGDFCWTTRTHTNTHMHIQTATKVVPWLFD